MTDEDAKIRHGQFYTLRNPFNHPLVHAWFKTIDKLDERIFVEPFAGANHLIKSIDEVFPQVKHTQWRAYDLQPEAITDSVVPDVPLIKQDTIANPPSGDVIITNPPYLAKNSAKRMGMSIDFGAYQDLYEISLAALLERNAWVAAIIPESFLTRKLFRERLYGFISITGDLFDDTDFPVGLALWVPAATEDYDIWIGAKHIGQHKALRKDTTLLDPHTTGLKVVFNDPQGPLGLQGIDNTVQASIAFVDGATIPSSTIKVSSRSITRISVYDEAGQPLITSSNVQALLPQLNAALATFRADTSDVFITAFKGRRKDGFYRRRLDFKIAKNLVLEILDPKALV